MASSGPPAVHQDRACGGRGGQVTGAVSARSRVRGVNAICTNYHFHHPPFCSGKTQTSTRIKQKHCSFGFSRLCCCCLHCSYRNRNITFILLCFAHACWIFKEDLERGGVAPATTVHRSKQTKQSKNLPFWRSIQKPDKNQQNNAVDEDRHNPWRRRNCL